MAVYDYEVGTIATATGTATINGTTAVVGSSTLFTTQLAVGYLIFVADEWRVVSVITDNTHLTVSAAFAGSSGGNVIQYVNMKNLADLSTRVTYPKYTFSPYSDERELGNGQPRGLGSPIAEWRWQLLKILGQNAYTQRDLLRTFVTTAAASIYIRTRVNDNAQEYRYFNVNAIWPQAEDRDAGRTLDFVMRFNAMEELDVGV